MKEYTIIFNQNKTEEFEAADRSDLIKKRFQNDEKLFKEQVSRVVWNEISMQCTLDVQTGKVHSEIFSADVNPYGWRDARG